MPSGPRSTPERRWWLANFIRGRACRICLLGVLLVVVQNPVSGLGYDLCTLHRWTNAPCPGCGMSRSGANMLRGDFRAAFNFHPFGFIIQPILFSLAILSVLPYSVRDAAASRLSRAARPLRWAETVFWVLFLIFGVVRWILVFAGVMLFPGHWL